MLQIIPRAFRSLLIIRPIKCLIFKDIKYYFALRDGYDCLVKKYKNNKDVVYIEFDFGKARVA